MHNYMAHEAVAAIACSNSFVSSWLLWRWFTSLWVALQLHLCATTMFREQTSLQESFLQMGQFHLCLHMRQSVWICWRYLWYGKILVCWPFLLSVCQISKTMANLISILIKYSAIWEQFFIHSGLPIDWTVAMASTNVTSSFAIVASDSAMLTVTVLCE